MVITVAGEKKRSKRRTDTAGIDRAGKCRDTGVCNRFY